MVSHDGTIAVLVVLRLAIRVKFGDHITVGGFGRFGHRSTVAVSAR
jgi:hypothetical protein